MSLTTGRGPLGPNRAGRFTAPVPDGVGYVEPHPRRIQARLGGATVLDTEEVLLVHRPGQVLTYAFRPGAVGDLPNVEVPEAPGYVSVPWDAVDTWIEEGRELVSYPPNPYHRIDCRPTRRHLRAEVAGTVLVDTDDTLILFETALAPRLYVARTHVLVELQPTATRTWCNYKGWATYWAATVDGTVVDDVAWSYEDPLPESTPIAGMLSFDEKVVEATAALPEPGEVPG